MHTTTSADGTAIAYDRVGAGPPIILVDGSLSCRAFSLNNALADELGDRFTVYRYDRRGRGDSGDTPPYLVRREIEDLDAVIDAAGGHAGVYGISSGAALALTAAAELGKKVSRLALYEPPFIIDDGRTPVPGDSAARLAELAGQGRRAAAVSLFMRENIQLPPVMVALMRLMPAWRKLKSVAHTVSYDVQVMAGTQQGQPLPPGRWAAITAPVLVVAGGKSPAWMRNAATSLAAELPEASYHVLDGQTHIVKATAIAPVLARYFTGTQSPARS